MIQPDSASIVWKIENFENSDSSWTSFDVKNKQNKFYLKCYPYDYVKHMDEQIGIYLYRHKPHSTDLKVLCRISLLNQEEQECYSKNIETSFTVESGYDPVDGDSYNLDRYSVLQPWNGLLRNGNLMIKCTVTILDCQKKSVNTNDRITLAEKKALSNYQSLLESSKYSDVVFVIGMKEFKLHKNILASQSPVFSVIFDSELEEAKQNRVSITDVDVEVFEAMIRFMYTANVDSVQQYALDLLVVADKYQLDSLKDICVDHLCSNLTIDSVANILLVADMHNAKELKSKCVDYISRNASEVVVSEGWRQLIKRRHELVFELYQDLASKSK